MKQLENIELTKETGSVNIEYLTSTIPPDEDEEVSLNSSDNDLKLNLLQINDTLLSQGSMRRHSNSQ